MTKGLLILLACITLGVSVAGAAQPKEDVFKGKLFAPNVILENRDELALSKQQPIDEEQVLEYVGAALRAENEVKKLQVAMLIRLKNLLTEEQIAHLESLRE